MEEWKKLFLVFFPSYKKSNSELYRRFNDVEVYKCQTAN